MIMALDSVAIGKRISQRRTELHMKQIQLSNSMDVSQGALSEIERGLKLPSAITLAKMSAVLQCTTDFILFGTSDTTAQKKTDLDKECDLLSDYYRLLDPDDRDDLMILARSKVSRLKKGTQQPSSSFLEEIEYSNHIS